MVALVVYTLCAAAAAVCTYLLFTAYRRSRQRLLMWSALAFAGLTLNNLALWLDKLALPRIDLSVLRISIGLIAMTVLLVGLIWEVQ